MNTTTQKFGTAEPRRMTATLGGTRTADRVYQVATALAVLFLLGSAVSL
jgi:hypothetical protein